MLRSERDRENASEEEVEECLAEFCTRLKPMDVATRSQKLGVAAAPMLRVPEMEEFPYSTKPAFLARLVPPCLDADCLMECAPVSQSRISRPPDNPAPLMGEQTREIASRLLGLDDDEIDHLIADNILFEAAAVSS